MLPFLHSLPKPAVKSKPDVLVLTLFAPEGFVALVEPNPRLATTLKACLSVINFLPTKVLFSTKPTLGASFEVLPLNALPTYSKIPSALKLIAQSPASGK